jgi:hypothetical protein
MDSYIIYKVNNKIFRLGKKIYQLLKSSPGQKSIMFVAGCQRSGTTIMMDTFEKDLNTRCFGETSELSSLDTKDGLRLNPLPTIKREFDKVNASFIVAKPLVESQNLPQLLDYFENSKAVWIFRHYKDVASSNLKFLGLDNGIKDLKPIVENELGNWRAEKVSDHVRKTISRFYSPDMNPYDAAALFWYTRNILFFDLALNEDLRVMMVKYEDFVVQPEKTMQGIYRHASQTYPKSGIAANTNSKSINKGRKIELSSGVERINQELLDRLERAYQLQKNRHIYSQANPIQ